MTNAPPPNAPLDNLPNLGKTTLMWLNAIGIRDLAGLRERGIYWAYERMQARGFRVTSAVLFSLEGALQERPWRSFSSAEKDVILKKMARSAKRPDISARPLPRAAGHHHQHQVANKPAPDAPSTGLGTAGSGSHPASQSASRSEKNR